MPAERWACGTTMRTNSSRRPPKRAPYPAALSPQLALHFPLRELDTRTQVQLLQQLVFMDIVGFNHAKQRQLGIGLARMAANGMGPSRRKCAHVVLHRVVAQAVRWGG